MILGMQPAPSLRCAALAALALSDPAGKAAQARALWDALQAGRLQTDADAALAEPPGLPGRPALPRLVPASQVATRSPFTLTGRAALLHAICHIEFNAINLALDAVWRFAGMPEQFYRDWLRVAAEDSSTIAAFCWVMRSISPIATLIWLRLAA